MAYEDPVSKKEQKRKKEYTLTMQMLKEQYDNFPVTIVEEKSPNFVFEYAFESNCMKNTLFREISSEIDEISIDTL